MTIWNRDPSDERREQQFVLSGGVIFAVSRMGAIGGGGGPPDDERKRKRRRERITKFVNALAILVVGSMAIAMLVALFRLSRL